MWGEHNFVFSVCSFAFVSLAHQNLPRNVGRLRRRVGHSGKTAFGSSANNLLRNIGRLWRLVGHSGTTAFGSATTTFGHGDFVLWDKDDDDDDVDDGE